MAGGVGSINKPRKKIVARAHANSIGKKRAARVKLTNKKSSVGRYSKTADPSPTDAKGLALYTGPSTATTEMITQTLSNKKARKLARNQKYIDARNNKPKVEEMEVDQEVKQTNLEKVKKALWSVVENYNNGGLRVQPDVEGTTLGVQAF